MAIGYARRFGTGRLLVVALGFFVAATAWGAAPGDPPPGDPLRIAVAAMISPMETVGAYQELMDHIGRRLGRPVELKQRRTYQEVNDLLGTGKLDAAILCSGPYVHARRQYGIGLLAVPVIQGSPTYRSYIIVPTGSRAASLLDLQGKRFAYTDPLSTSGRLYPVYAIMRAGHRPAAFFTKTFFTFSHDNSIEAVAEGLADGAAVDSLIYDYLKRLRPEQIARTRVVQESPPLGSQPVGVPRGLDPALRARLQAVFLELDRDPEARPILAKLGVDRFIPGEDRHYDGIRRMLRTVEGVTPP